MLLYSKYTFLPQGTLETLLNRKKGGRPLVVLMPAMIFFFKCELLILGCNEINRSNLITNEY